MSGSTDIYNSFIRCRQRVLYKFCFLVLVLVLLSEQLLEKNILLYPEWPHRQCVGLAFRRSHDRGSLSAVSPVICSPTRIAVCNTWSSGDTALCRVGGATSQLDRPGLTPLSVAGCG